MSITQDQIDAAKATLEAELAESTDEREKLRVQEALEQLAKLVATDATE